MIGFFSRRKRSKAERILKLKIRSAAALTLDEYERVVSLTGCHPDRALQDEEEMQKLLSASIPPEKLAQVLGILAPGHGIDVRRLRVADCDSIGATVLASFTFASATSLVKLTSKSSR